MIPILSDHQAGSRNAKVYKTANGRFGVILYNSDDDYNGFECFDDSYDAEKYAENWVKRTIL